MKAKITLCLSLLATVALAQKQDYKWVINHICGLPQATQLDFNSSPVEASVVDREMCVLITNSSVCDETGEMLLYTNGLAVYNKYDEIIENGDSLNFGFWSTSAGDAGYNVPQGVFFIEKPGDNNIYYLFHMFIGYENGTIPLSPRYSVIDVGYNNGTGKVIEKNVPMLVSDQSVNYCQATAVRHANGRDWWIIVPNHMGPQYYLFLLSPNGIEGPWMQEIGFREVPVNFWANGFGQRVFSLDGNKFADYDFDNFTQVFDFDRCTGFLSNAKLIDHGIDSLNNNAAAGVAFSPSGRFLYISRAENGYTLKQYDTETSNIFASEIEIYDCPLIGSQFTCGIGNLRLAPDNRIYIGSGDSIWLSIIKEPDSLGLACDFEFNGFTLPLAYPGAYFPYWPNYRLGALEGSGCDTILSYATEPYLKKIEFQLSPNPVQSFVDFKLPDEIPHAILTLRTSTGQYIHTQHLTAGQNTEPLEGIAPGLYFYEVWDEGKILQSGKLVKIE